MAQSRQRYQLIRNEMKRNQYGTFVAVFLLVLPFQLGLKPAGKIPVYARNGMVVSASMVASEIGREVLEKGGNAIDAAVATAFALAVTWPPAGNIGGGGFLVYLPSNGEATTFDFREKAPLAASEDMFLDETGQIKDNSNHDGLLAVGVPGTVAGLYQAHQKYGSKPWKELVEPAVTTNAWGRSTPGGSKPVNVACHESC